MPHDNKVSTETPVSIKVKDMLNFARLVLALTDSHQIVWNITDGSKRFLAFLTGYLYWKGNLPVLAYVNLKDEDKPFLAYRSDSPRGEELKLLRSMDDLKYRYASLVEIEDCPEIFLKALRGGRHPPPPLCAPIRDGRPLMRLLIALTLREGTGFPVWHFKKNRFNILGTFIPFEYHYDSDALPMFIYFKLRESPAGSFLKYKASETKGEQLEFSNDTGDAKYFYTKVISVDDFPLTRKVNL